MTETDVDKLELQYQTARFKLNMVSTLRNSQRDYGLSPQEAIKQIKEIIETYEHLV